MASWDLSRWFLHEKVIYYSDPPPRPRRCAWCDDQRHPDAPKIRFHRVRLKSGKSLVLCSKCLELAGRYDVDGSPTNPVDEDE